MCNSINFNNLSKRQKSLLKHGFIAYVLVELEIMIKEGLIC